MRDLEYKSFELQSEALKEWFCSAFTNVYGDMDPGDFGLEAEEDELVTCRILYAYGDGIHVVDGIIYYDSGPEPITARMCVDKYEECESFVATLPPLASSGWAR
ncbi:MAG: hypothetical protein AB7I48_24730 [Planctomycetaceae bacterium]